MSKFVTGDAIPDDHAHILALDGVRGIAILLVVVYHWYAYSRLITSPSGGLIPTAITNVIDVGWTGVDLFFVLSGFLITGILFDAKEGRGFFRNFYARRILRIFPAYYGYLLLLIVVLPLLLRDNVDLSILRHNQLYYWTYLYNVWIPLRPLTNIGLYGNGHIWSLAVEEQFYLVWPLVVFAFGRRMLMAICAACVAGALLLRIALIVGAVSDLNNIYAPIMLMPARIDTLALGGMLALAMRAPSERALVRRFAPYVAVAALLVVAVLFAYKRELSPFDHQVQTLGFSAFAFLFAAMIALVITSGTDSRLRWVCERTPLRFFGRYSYALYIIHLQIAILAAKYVGEHRALPDVAGSPLPSRFAFTIAGVAVSVAFAWCSWHLYEQRVLKLKRYFPYQRRASAEPPTGADAMPTRTAQ